MGPDIIPELHTNLHEALVHTAISQGGRVIEKEVGGVRGGA